jgi:glutaredoxin-like protein NrdH
MSQTTITVYSKPSCVQCTATYRALDKLALEYTVVDISQDDQARQVVMAMGHLQAPVVVVTTGETTTSWAGYRPDQLKALTATAAA